MNPWDHSDPVYPSTSHVFSFSWQLLGAGVYKNYTADYKFFQEQKSRRFPVFPGGISNSRRFPVFPVFPAVVDTLHFLTGCTNASQITHFVTYRMNPPVTSQAFAPFKISKIYITVQSPTRTAWCLIIWLICCGRLPRFSSFCDLLLLGWLLFSCFLFTSVFFLFSYFAA